MENQSGDESAQDLLNSIDVYRVAALEQGVEDVIEITNILQLSYRLQEIQKQPRRPISLIERMKQGIVFHEAAANSKRLQGPLTRGNSLHSYSIFTDLLKGSVIIEALPLLTAYRASSLALLGLETGQMKEVKNSFALFNESVRKYKDVSPMPQFLRGKIARRLPWYFFLMKRNARPDFEDLVERSLNADPAVLNQRIISFSFYELAKLLGSNGEDHRVIACLDGAIALDPNSLAAREDTETMKLAFLKGRMKKTKR